MDGGIDLGYSELRPLRLARALAAAGGGRTIRARRVDEATGRYGSLSSDRSAPVAICDSRAVDPTVSRTSPPDDRVNAKAATSGGWTRRAPGRDLTHFMPRVDLARGRGLAVAICRQRSMTGSVAVSARPVPR